MQRVAVRLAEVTALAGGMLIVAIMLVTSVNVTGFALDRFARLAGGSVSGLPGYEDFVSLAISSAALLFMPYCQLRRGHVNVELFVSMLPHAVRRLLDRLWLLATMLVTLALAYWMVYGVLETRSDNVRSAILGWPVWPFYLPGIVSLVLWAAVALMQIFSEHESV